MSSEINLEAQSRVDQLKQGMVGEIKRIMPKLRDVEALGGRFNLDHLKERSFKAPAAFPTVLKSDYNIRADRTLWMMANCACFFVTEGRQDARENACWAMAEGFAKILTNNTFGQPYVGAPESVSVDPLMSANVRAKGVAIIAITWKQTIKQIGSTLFDDDGVMLEALYLNGSDEPHYVLNEAAQ